MAKDNVNAPSHYLHGKKETIDVISDVMTASEFHGYLKGNILNLQIGFSHDVSYKIPDGIKILVEKSTIIKISGIDKELVGKVSSEIRKLKPVEPYKAKGIKERGQYVLRKEGKKK